MSSQPVRLRGRGESREPLDVGSTLCLSCGMCCDGTLYAWAPLEEDEVERFSSKVRVTQINERSVMRLACPRLDDARCTIYDEGRPHICGAFSCDLLRRTVAGEVGVEEAHAMVADVREKVVELRAALSPQVAGVSLVEAILESQRISEEGPAQWRRTNAEPLLLALEIDLLLKRNFDKNRTVGARQAKGVSG